VRRRSVFTAVLSAAVFAASGAGVAAAASPPTAFWTPVGPAGAVVLSLARFPSSPEVLYAGVDHGGVFRSDDAGLHWHSVSVGLPDPGVSAVAVSPGDANVVVAGAQSGLYFSVNGGTSWALAAGSPGTGINAVVFDPAGASIAYAVSSAGWAGRSADGGASWTPIGASLFAQQPTAIAVAPSAHTTLYMGTLQNGVYKSTDSGATWTDVNFGLTNLHVSALAVHPTDAQNVFAGTVNGGVFLTHDSGAHWEPTGTFVAVNAVAVDSAGTAYAGVQTGAYVLPSGATAWSAIPGSVWVNALALGAGTPPRLYLGYGKLPFDVGGAAYYESSVFHVIVDGLNGITVNTFAVDDMDAETRILAGTVGLGLIQSQDGARSWTQVSGLGQNSILDVTVVAGTTEAFYVGAAGGVFRSTDEGATWTSVSNGLPTQPPSPVGSLLIPSGGGGAFLAGTYHGLFRSTDSAASWSQVTAGLPALVFYSLTADPASSGVVYAATEQGVFKSTDGGSSWSAANAGITGSLVYDVLVVGGSVFAAGEGGLFRSGNGGGSWEKATDLPASPAHAIAYDPSTSTLYAGTYAGVYETDDLGATWVHTGASGPSNPQILSLAVLPQGGLLAGTLGGSVFLLSAPDPRESVERVTPRGGTRTLPPRP